MRSEAVKLINVWSSPRFDKARETHVFPGKQEAILEILFMEVPSTITSEGSEILWTEDEGDDWGKDQGFHLSCFLQTTAVRPEKKQKTKFYMAHHWWFFLSFWFSPRQELEISVKIMDLRVVGNVSVSSCFLEYISGSLFSKETWPVTTFDRSVIINECKDHSLIIPLSILFYDEEWFENRLKCIYYYCCIITTVRHWLFFQTLVFESEQLCPCSVFQRGEALGKTTR